MEKVWNYAQNLHQSTAGVSHQKIEELGVSTILGWPRNSSQATPKLLWGAKSDAQ
jgi:hypothetical protein